MVQSSFRPCTGCNRQVSVNVKACPFCGCALLPVAAPPPETVVVEAIGNMYRGIEAVGGRLTVTNLRLKFKPHALNFQNQPSEFPLNEIEEVSPFSTLGIIPNGVQITLKSGVVHTFCLLSGRTNLINKIRENLHRVY